MAGIYIHIPFCKQACHYCNFHFSTNLKRRTEMVDAIISELEMRSDFFDNHDIETIYFGGGTPSVLSAKELIKILTSLQQHFQWRDGIEITLEANPDDLTLDKLQELYDGGINRLSIGIQSFLEADLVYMNRSHSARQAHTCIEEAYRVGFANLSLDLIFGIPHSTHETWNDNLEMAMSFDPTHLSCYNLTIEPKTVFEKWVSVGKIADIDQEQSATQFLHTHDFLTKHGYDHYEISNYASGDKLAQHNTNYWRGKSYLGLGPSAHSFDGTKRYWNINNNALYLSMIKKGELPITDEKLSLSDRYNEYIMTSLRTKWGCDYGKLQELLAKESHEFEELIKIEIDRGHVVENDKNYTLTREGMLYADQIISNLFSVQEG